MRKYLVGIVLGLTLSLGGCSGLVVHSDPAKLVTPQQKVNASIDQANATIAAAARQLKSMYAAKILNPEEAQTFYDKLLEAATYTDQASKLFDSGNFDSAQGQLTLAKTITDEVVAYLVKVKNQGVK